MVLDMLTIPPCFGVAGANSAGKYAHTLPVGMSTVAIAEKQIVIRRPYVKQSVCRMVIVSSVDDFLTVKRLYLFNFAKSSLCEENKCSDAIQLAQACISSVLYLFKT